MLCLASQKKGKQKNVRDSEIFESNGSRDIEVQLQLPVKKMIYFCFRYVRAELIKLAEMLGVMHEEDHAHCIRSTWRLHRLATDAPFIACVILKFTKYFCLQLRFVEFSLRIWIVVFLSSIYLSPVGLFCECCRMSLL